MDNDLPQSTALRSVGSVRVGAAELDLLHRRWNHYQAISDRNRSGFDPVASLRSVGALMNAVERVVAATSSIRPDGGSR